MVFLSTFLTATGASWVAVRATHGFLEERLDRSYPALLTGTARRVTEWLEEGRGELRYRLEQRRLGSAPGPRLSAWQRDSRFFVAVVHFAQAEDVETGADDTEHPEDDDADGAGRAG